MANLIRGAVCTNTNAPKTWWNSNCQFISGNERYAIVYCRINHKKGSASTLWIVKRDDLEVHEAKTLGSVRAKVVPMWDNADSDESNFLAAMYWRLVERAKELNRESAAKEYADSSLYRSGSNPVALRGGFR